MDTKVCFICKEEKQTDQFYKNSAKKDGLEYACKACIKKRDNNYYRTNPEYRKRVLEKSKQTHIRNGLYIIDYLSTHSCIDCGETNPIVLQFDHVRGTKIRNITQLVHSSSPIKKLQEEIEKCEVRCANCHQIKTAMEQSWYRYLYKNKDKGE